MNLRSSAVFASLVLCVSSTGLSQTVRGRITEERTGAPLTGAFVVLEDSAGARRAAALTDSTGWFIIRAYPGRFVLRAELIGHRTSRSAYFDGSRDVLINLSLAIDAIGIQGIEVTSKRTCVMRPELGAQTARVWDEVRKALTVTAWGQQANEAPLATRTYRRILDPRTLAIRQESIGEEVRSRTYAAIDPDTLARYGFVRSMPGDSIGYFGPDANVLLSESFLDTHCFGIVNGANETQGWLGLSFRPAPGRRLADISGTLWLDPKTSELKFIEFRYTNLPRAMESPKAGGRTSFRRLRNGAWIVDRWFIRMPMITRSLTGYEQRVFQEDGGEVVVRQ